MGANGTSFGRQGNLKTSTHPLAFVEWQDIELNHKTICHRFILMANLRGGGLSQPRSKPHK